MNHLKDKFGNIDIYLFDQLLKGRIAKGDKILDAGCGSRRNIQYLLQQNHTVFGVDQNQESIEHVKVLAEQNNDSKPDLHFKTSNLDNLPFETAFFDFVICSAVLHFAENEAHFDAMLNELWRVLKPEGVLFIRLASNIGIEHLIQLISGGRYLLPDGSERYLVSQDQLLTHTYTLGATLLDPIKTTNVQDLRCMTTWVISKNKSSN